MKIDNKKIGFTILETMIVLIIVGIIASFAVPNYARSIEHGYERNARVNLMSMQSSSKIIQARTGAYPIFTTSNIEAINSNLSLSIDDNNFNYTYTSDGTALNITAVRAASADYTLTITGAPISDTNPSCVDGAGECF